MHSTSDLAPPSSHRIPTCRYGQMSKWRQKGFVQDSDEDEEESQLESQGSRRNAALQGRVERADDLTIPEEGQKDDGIDAVNTTEVGGQLDNAGRESVHAAREVEFRSPVTRRLSPRRPTASPLTPAATYGVRREPTESPDPLQASQKRNNMTKSQYPRGSPAKLRLYHTTQSQTM
jgi:hypothetical protein